MPVITFLLMQQTLSAVSKQLFWGNTILSLISRWVWKHSCIILKRGHTRRRREHCSVRQMSPGNEKNTRNPSLSNTELFQKSFLSLQKIFCNIRTERKAPMEINSSILVPKENKFLSPLNIHILHWLKMFCWAFCLVWFVALFGFGGFLHHQE